MTAYKDRSREELLEEKKALAEKFDEIKAKGLKLDMSRGKPSAAQLDLAMGMMDVLNSSSDLKCEEGVDCRNYGVLDGIREAKELLADMTEVAQDNIIIYGNSSLNIMYDTCLLYTSNQSFVRTLQPVCNQDMTSGGIGGEAVYISTLQMIQGILTAAHVEGVAVSQKRLSSQLLYCICHHFCIIWAQIGQVAGFAEMNFDGSIFSLKINIPDAGCFDEAFQLLEEIVIYFGTHASEINF